MYPVNTQPVPGMVKVILAENQTADYTPLPALRDAEKTCTEWEFTAEERQQIAEGGRIRFWQWTGIGPFQPIAVSVVPIEETLALEPVQ